MKRLFLLIFLLLNINVFAQQIQKKQYFTSSSHYEQRDQIILGTHFIQSEKKRVKLFLKSIKSMGISYIRIPLLWRQVELHPEQYNWSITDKIISMAVKHNFEVIFNLRAVSPWGSGNRQNNRQKKGYQKSSYPKNKDAYIQFLRTFIKRYRGKINFIQIENEPNAKSFWSGTFKEYLSLLKLSYQTIKKANPNMKVISAGLACGVSSPQMSKSNLSILKAQAESILKSKYFDIFDIHNYYPIQTQGTPYTINFKSYLNIYYQIFKELNIDPEVWLTEVGVPSETYTFPSRKQYQSSEERQYQDFKSIMSIAASREIKALFWIKIFDSKEWMFSHMGLITEQGNKKKAFRAIFSK
jgi:GH35 family endo-1,4-beta-xylanase